MSRRRFSPPAEHPENRSGHAAPCGYADFTEPLSASAAGQVWRPVGVASPRATQHRPKGPLIGAFDDRTNHMSGQDQTGEIIRQVSRSLRQAWDVLPEFIARLTVRRDSGPIDGIDAMCRFVSTRSAFVAQKTLYGYLKTRMGSRYPRMFEDDVIIASIDIAKMHVFAACLSDLSIYAVSCALRDAPDESAHNPLAEQCFDAGLADNEEQALRVQAFSITEAKADFLRRLAFLDWHSGSTGAAHFTASPRALFEWAPIAPELKRSDQEIVENSIRFAWRDVRAQFEKRIDGDAIVAALSGRCGPIDPA